MDLLEYIYQSKALVFFWWCSILILGGYLTTKIVTKVHRLFAASLTFTNDDDISDVGRILTLSQTVSWTVKVIIWIVIFMMIGTKIGIPPSVLALFSTIFGAGLGFGLQSLFKDVVSSVVHISEKLFDVGDFVVLETSAGTIKGTVENVNLRNIRISSLSDGMIFVPQGSVSVVKNYNKGTGRFSLETPFSPHDNIGEIVQIIGEIIENVKNYPELFNDSEGLENILDVNLVGINSVSHGTISIEINGTTDPGSQYSAKVALLKVITSVLYEKGINYKSDELYMQKGVENG